LAVTITITTTANIMMLLAMPCAHSLAPNTHADRDVPVETRHRFGAGTMPVITGGGIGWEKHS
jgi:hypothetical protein